MRYSFKLSQMTHNLAISIWYCVSHVNLIVREFKLEVERKGIITFWI